MLDFMNPIPPGRRLVGSTRQARFDEAGETAGMRTQQHGDEIIAPAWIELALQITAWATHRAGGCVAAG